MHQQLKILVFLILNFCLTGSLFSQNLSLLSELVDDKGKKAVEKALDNIKTAEKLIIEANEYYNEALALQSNFELDEKTLQKKLDKAESSAIESQLKADKSYAAAYKSLYDLCINTLQGSNVSYGESGSLESGASDMMQQAESKRKSADESGNVYEKAALLNEAIGLESAAIDNLIVALQVQQGITPVQEEVYEPSYSYEEEESYTTPSYTEPAITDYNASVEQKSENLAIDHKVIEDYNNYKNDPTIPDPIVVNRSGVSGVDEVSVEQARKVLHGEGGYQTGYTQPTTPERDYQTPETEGSSTAAVVEYASEDYITPVEEYISEGSSEYFTETPEDDVARDTRQDTGKDYKQERAQDSRHYTDISAEAQSSELSFVVQIAASRVPLARTQIEAIFKGNETVEAVKEGNWYKYQITGFRLFSDANLAAVRSGVKDAWVLSKAQGRYIDLVDAREMTRVLETDVKRYGRTALKNETDYYIQVVASKIKLSDEKISQYSSGMKCREVIEEGWYKYQVYAGIEYKEAQALKNRFGSDAFIVAYEKGIKVKLYKAINKEP